MFRGNSEPAWSGAKLQPTNRSGCLNAGLGSDRGLRADEMEIRACAREAGGKVVDAEREEGESEIGVRGRDAAERQTQTFAVCIVR
eukprot:6178172-Pleurochrysis_carterae.AAC.9